MYGRYHTLAEFSDGGRPSSPGQRCRMSSIWSGLSFCWSLTSDEPLRVLTVACMKTPVRQKPPSSSRSTEPSCGKRRSLRDCGRWHVRRTALAFPVWAFLLVLRMETWKAIMFSAQLMEFLSSSLCSCEMQPKNRPARHSSIPRPEPTHTVDGQNPALPTIRNIP